MSKIGFFGGSFNPLTIAHINLAIKIVNVCKLDKLIFVPIGDFYKKKDLIIFKHRYNMIKLACSVNKYLDILDIEDNQKTRLYAIDTFEIIKKQYINDDIYFIMGTDNLEKIKDWKSYNNLITQYKYIILERKENAFYDILKNNVDIKEHKDNFIVVSDYKYKDISSSLVREKIKKNEDISKLVSKEIEEYIKENNLYK